MARDNVMKNKIITLLCILEILITTLVVSVTDDRVAYDFNADNDIVYAEN